MRFIRLALLSLIFLFLVIWGLSLLLPSHIRLSKAINVKAPADSVNVMISNPLNWKYWYPGMDSSLPFYENGVIRGMIINREDSIHPVYLVLDKVEKSEATALFMGRKMKPVVNTWKTIAYQGSDSLTIQWSMDFNLRWYPWEKFASVALEKTYAPKMEQGLMDLKKKVHGSP